MSFESRAEQKRTETMPKISQAIGSAYGRPMTTIESARSELFHHPERVDPVPWIENAIKENATYFGQYHTNNDEPFMIQNSEKTHSLIVGSTGCGKGVLLGNKVLEAIKSGRGVIIVDPKEDAFMPQIVKEEMIRNGRENDMLVFAWPNRTGYTAINKDDTHIEIANKIINALSLEEVIGGNEGVNYYRRNARVLLTKILKIFFDGDLGVIVKKDFKDILQHLRHLKEDMEKEELFNKEASKPNRNENLMAKWRKRFFDPDKVSAIYWDKTTIESLDSLSKTIGEIAETANLQSEFDLREALHNGKVIYLKVDMLDAASLKMVKMMLVDAIQLSRKKKANTLIVADEASFYVSKFVASASATIRSFGLELIISVQDLTQFPEDIREEILSNMNVKVFYKSSGATLNYLSMIGGDEVVSMISDSGDGKKSIRQGVEPNLNITRLRALPRAGVAVVVAEALNAPVVIKTNFVAVSGEFDWPKYNRPSDFKFIKYEEPKDKFETFVEINRIFEDSELFGVTIKSRALQE